jgi:hypothetical protein
MKIPWFRGRRAARRQPIRVQQTRESARRFTALDGKPTLRMRDAFRPGVTAERPLQLPTLQAHVGSEPIELLAPQPRRPSWFDDRRLYQTMASINNNPNSTDNLLQGGHTLALFGEAQDHHPLWIQGLGLIFASTSSSHMAQPVIEELYRVLTSPHRHHVHIDQWMNYEARKASFRVLESAGTYFRSLGYIHWHWGAHAEAQLAFDMAYHVFRALSRFHNDQIPTAQKREALLAMPVMAECMGDIAMEEKRHYDAEQSYRHARGLCNAHIEPLQSVSYREQADFIDYGLIVPGAVGAGMQSAARLEMDIKELTKFGKHLREKERIAYALQS